VPAIGSLLFLALIAVSRADETEFFTERYQSQLDRYQDWTYEQLAAHLGINDGPTDSLSFDPEDAAHYETICRNLQLTDEERQMYCRNGLVVVDFQQQHSFASAYYQIYAQDLPVLITTDSVLHAWHRSYGKLLEQLEAYILRPELEALLGQCAEDLAKQGIGTATQTATAYRDVDLYLTVARNLLAGAGEPGWDGDMPVPSVFGVDVEVRQMLSHISSLKLQVQYPRTDATLIYGGERYIDYSQFAPRGHYALTSDLQQYFRTVMWLGRPDCGFHVLPVDPRIGLFVDYRRELRSAALLSQLLRDSGNGENLQAMVELRRLLVGDGDNLSVPQMLASMDSVQVGNVEALMRPDSRKLEQLANVLGQSGDGQQQIRSQAIVSDPGNDCRVAPPAIFQLFGQAFVADAFVLSHMVFDSILFEGRKTVRIMPSSLDVAAALGNPLAVKLLEPELRHWHYSANLMAGRELLSQLSPDFWTANVHHAWLDALRTLDDPPATGALPQVMRRVPWQAKQLQTQLASWSELRHDHSLYAKQSYTGVPGCSYPAAYVEPYPELYLKLGRVATETARRLKACEFSFDDSADGQWRAELLEEQLKFLNRFADIMAQLESIARLELDGNPLSEKQRRFVESTVDRRGTMPHGSGTKPRYDGWYCDLLYGLADPAAVAPTVADVHTHPSSHEVLQVGVGHVRFALVAIDNGDELGAFVGPVYSVFEFTRRAEERLTDRAWQNWIAQGTLPPKPEWTASFAATPFGRSFDGLNVHCDRASWQIERWVEGRFTPLVSGRMNDEGLSELLNFLEVNGYPKTFGLMAGQLSDAGLASLASVPQLAWLDFDQAAITQTAIQEFQRRRPDVAVLRGEFKLAPLMTLVEVADQPPVKWAVVEEWWPGQNAAIHIQPANPAWTNDDGKLVARFNATAFWLDESGATEVMQELGRVQIGLKQRYLPLGFTVPPTLNPGSKTLRVTLADLVDGSKSTSAETPITIVAAPGN
jgi:hypothetical protein